MVCCFWHICCVLNIQSDLFPLGAISMHEPSGAPFAVMTYNILVGGSDGRLQATEAVIRHYVPDIVGVQEANDPAALHALAERLGMHCIMGYAASGYHVALLSRWPIRAWTQHGRPIFQKALLEAVIDLPGEAQPWHVFVAHLTADFFRGHAAERRRVAEIRAILDCMAPARERGTPHLLMGDFNTLAPGEPFHAVGLLSRVIELDAERERTRKELAGHPHLAYVVPPPLHPLLPLIRRIPSTPPLAWLFSQAANRWLPRWAVPPLLDAGYVDCVQAAYGAAPPPPTCPLPEPAGRIDYLWAYPSLAARLCGCAVIEDAPGCPVNRASDHRPVLARFARVPAALPEREADLAPALAD
jgi:endonuclease/exonuclease/phosphatase family metal-dependent hydrolase